MGCLTSLWWHGGICRWKRRDTQRNALVADRTIQEMTVTAVICCERERATEEDKQIRWTGGRGGFISDLQKEYPLYTHACLSNTHSSFSPPQRQTRWKKKASEQTHCREPSRRKTRVSRPLEALELVHNLSWVSFLISKENAFEVQRDTANQILSVSILGSYSEPTRDTPGPQGVDQNMECLEGRMYCNTFFYAALNIHQKKHVLEACLWRKMQYI